MNRQEKRDAFAMAALAEVVQLVTAEDVRRQLLGAEGLDTAKSCKAVAVVAYNIADAMLAESELREATS